MHSVHSLAAHTDGKSGEASHQTNILAQTCSKLYLSGNEAEFHLRNGINNSFSAGWRLGFSEQAVWNNFIIFVW